MADQQQAPEWHKPLQEVRDIAVDAHSIASYARDGLVNQGHHIEKLDERVGKVEVDASSLREEMKGMPNKIVAKLFWLTAPFALTVIASLGYLILENRKGG